MNVVFTAARNNANVLLRLGIRFFLFSSLHLRCKSEIRSNENKEFASAWDKRKMRTRQNRNEFRFPLQRRNMRVVDRYHVAISRQLHKCSANVSIGMKLNRIAWLHLYNESTYVRTYVLFSFFFLAMTQNLVTLIFFTYTLVRLNPSESDSDLSLTLQL